MEPQEAAGPGEAVPPEPSEAGGHTGSAAASCGWAQPGPIEGQGPLPQRPRRCWWHLTSLTPRSTLLSCGAVRGSGSCLSRGAARIPPAAGSGESTATTTAGDAGSPGPQTLPTHICADSTPGHSPTLQPGTNRTSPEAAGPGGERSREAAAAALQGEDSELGTGASESQFGGQLVPQGSQPPRQLVLLAAHGALAHS